MADEKKSEKKISILNLSKTGRRFDLKDGPGGEKRSLLANKSIEVDADEAAFLLGKLPSGAARYHDLVDLAKFNPQSTRAHDELLEENKALLKENAELKAKLETANKGGKK